MKRRKFRFWHLLVGTLLLVAIEFLVLHFLPETAASITLVLVVSVLGASFTIYVATEVIEEVRGAFHMIVLLCGVVCEFVVFFAFQYLFLLVVQPASFPTLPQDPSSLLLHSVMVFVFNPLYIPGTSTGRVLLLIQTFAALGLALFVLQNINEFRRTSLDHKAPHV